MGKLTTTIGIFFLTFLIHFPSVSNDFVLDDRVQIVENHTIRNIENAEQLFYEPMYPGNLYRPLVMLSYMLNYHYVGLDPLPYHLTNVVGHATVASILFLFLTFLFSSSRSLLITLLFAFHPITSEVVANVSGRAEILAAGFGLLSLLFFFANDFRRLTPILAIPLGLAFFLLALAAKESALVLPLLYLLGRTYGEDRQYLRDAALPLLCFALAIPLYLYYRFQVLDIGFADIPYVDNPLVFLDAQERLGKAYLLLGKYLMLLFFPIQMSADYSFGQISPETIDLFSAEWSIPAFLVIGASLISISYLATREALAFFCLWFFLAFAITANIFLPIGTVFAERLAYLPSIGVAGIIVVFFDTVFRPGKRDFFVIILAIVFAVLTIRAERHWKDEKTLIVRQRQITPNSVRALYNHGILLRNQGLFSDAKREFQEALTIYGSYAEAAYGVGTVEVHLGNVAEAERWLGDALAMNENFVPALTMLGRIRLVQKRDQDALELFQQAFIRDSRNEEAMLGLFALALRNGDREKAELWKRKLKEIATTNKEFDKLNVLLEKVQNSSVSQDTSS